MHLVSKRWHDQYGQSRPFFNNNHDPQGSYFTGDIVRFGPSSLMFNTSSAMNTIYGVRANVSKAEGYATLSPSRSPNILSARDKNVHAFKRKTQAHVYSEQGLKVFEDRVMQNIKDFSRVLVSGWDKPGDGWTASKNVAHICDHLTFDVICDLAYGEDFDTLHLPNVRWFLPIIRKILQRGTMVRIAVTCVSNR